MKLAVIGGGSTYTPELVDGLSATLDGGVTISELHLYDTDKERVETVGRFAQRMLQASNSSTRLSYGTDLEAAVDGAAATLLQLRVGGQQSRARDEHFPLECGCIGQETTGAGGFAKALRTVPIVRALADDVRRLAPDSWIVDFTNPVGIVTRALTDDGHRVLGLCNVAIGFQRLFAQMLGCSPDDVVLGHAGLNHLSWIRSVQVGGVEKLPWLIEHHGVALAERLKLPLSLLVLTASVPSYYLRFFYAHDEVVREMIEHGTRAQQVIEIEKSLLEIYANPQNHLKPPLLEQRGGAYYSQAALQLLDSLLGPQDRAARHVVNMRNNGVLPFLTDEAIIEVPAMVSPSGAIALPVPPLAPAMSGLIAHVAAYEELAVDAARNGGYDRIVEALLAHPLVGQYDLAVRLADTIVADNKDHLPWAR